MNKTKWMQMALAASLLIMTSALAAQAQNARSYVSGLGNDANAPGCTQALPCRTFNTAIGVTNAGGQVVALDSAGYGGITNPGIIKAITIEGAPGVHAFIFVGTGATGIIVVGGASDTIILENIFVAAAPGATSTTGLAHLGGKLIVRNCTFEQLTLGVGTTAKMDLIDSDLMSNTKAVQATGDGADSGGPCPACFVAGNTMIRINGGNILNNGTALVTVSPGVGSGGNKQNIWLFNYGNTSTTNFTGNTTLMEGVGTGCGVSLCTIPQSYGGTTNPR